MYIMLAVLAGYYSQNYFNTYHGSKYSCTENDILTEICIGANSKTCKYKTRHEEELRVQKEVQTQSL